MFFLFFIGTNHHIYANTEKLQDNITIDQLQEISPFQEKPEPQNTPTPLVESKVTIDKSLKKSDTLMLSISNNLIYFGDLTPTNPLIRTHTISVINLLSPMYNLFISENHPLINANGSFIPNTTCDNGACTEYTAGIWDSTLTFGLGYRCENIDGYDCENGFYYDQTYKQIPDESKNKKSISLMEGLKENNPKSINMLYKLNTSASQQSGPYTNIVTYTLTPSF